MRLPRAQQVQVWPVDEEEDFLLPRGLHNDRSDNEPDFEDGSLEIIEDELDSEDDLGAVLALLAGLSLGGV